MLLDGYLYAFRSFQMYVFMIAMSICCIWMVLPVLIYRVARRIQLKRNGKSVKALVIKKYINQRNENKFYWIKYTFNCDQLNPIKPLLLVYGYINNYSHQYVPKSINDLISLYYIDMNDHFSFNSIIQDYQIKKKAMI